MAQTLLAICQQASREMGITAPATIISNTDLYAVQLLNLFNGLGQDLAQEYDWQGLTREHSFSTEFYQYTGDSTSGSTSLTNMSSIASLDTTLMIEGTGVPTDTFISDATGTTVVMSREATATDTTETYTFSKVQYALPTGFARLIDRTEWDKTQSWPMPGPMSAQGWQSIKGFGIASGGPPSFFRIIRNLFQIYPPLGSENFLRYEYVSQFWGATSASATPTLSTVTADTDTNIYPDRLMVEGLKLRFRMARNDSAMKSYRPEDIASGFPMRLLNIAKANDAGSPDLTMIPRRTSILLGEDNFPEGDLGA